jgi:ubiquinone biosynthesis protein UbiJ
VVNPSLPFELILAQFERALNHALVFSMEWPDYAHKLEGVRMCCILLPINQKVYLEIKQAQVYMTAHGREPVDLTIKCTPSALLDLAQHKRAGSQIEISGNAHLAQTLQQILSELKIDWEGLLAEHLGDLAAKQVSSFFDKFKVLTTRFVKTSLADTADYLVDERGLLPAQSEVDAFYSQVKDLRYATDRLEARIRALEVK